MRPSLELTERIEALIESYCVEGSDEPLYLKRLAKQYRVLPVLIDWYWFFGLCPSGDVLVIPTEEPEEPRKELEARVCRIAIYRGSLKYPDLQPLVPPRSPRSVDCHHCEGRGRIDLPGIEPNTIVCYCGGLGWLEEEEVVAESHG